MKLATYRRRADQASGSPRIGAVQPERGVVIDLAAGYEALEGRACRWFEDMVGFLEGGEAAREQAQRVIERVSSQGISAVVDPLRTVTWYAPVPRPRSIRDCMAFERHVTNMTRQALTGSCRVLAAFDGWIERWRGRGVIRPPRVWYERPIDYKGNPHSVVGHEAEVRWPSYAARLDYELEFGVFLGRGGCNIRREHAEDAIGGFTIFNDFSTRDVQWQEMRGGLGPSKGKDFDTGNAMGPYLVTPDEVGDPYGLTMLARVNGEVWSRGSSHGMAHSFGELIAYISRDETLHPGEFIGSGTVANGCGLELGRWLQAGDVVELEVERLGILRPDHPIRWSGGAPSLVLTEGKGASTAVGGLYPHPAARRHARCQTLLLLWEASGTSEERCHRVRCVLLAECDTLAEMEWNRMRRPRQARCLANAVCDREVMRHGLGVGPSGP